MVTDQSTTARVDSSPVYAARKAGMNADDLARIAAALVAAIAQAKTRARTFGIDPDFREIVRQAREMHDLLTEARHSFHLGSACLRPEASRLARWPVELEGSGGLATLRLNGYELSRWRSKNCDAAV
jgi:hypothetical protein